MAITFINAATAFVETGVTTITVNKPTNTENGDVMIAAFALRPNTATVSTLAGWTSIRNTSNANSTSNRLATFFKVANNEGASYGWTLASTPAGCVGGICTFRGVAGNTLATIVNIENGLAQSVSSVNVPTPDVTTTLRDTMLVTAHGVSNRDTWNPPAAVGGDPAMNEAVDNRPATAAICLGMFWVPHVLASATGQKVAVDGGPDAADVGTAHIAALIPAVASTSIRAAQVTSRNVGPRVLRFRFRQPTFPMVPGVAGVGAFTLNLETGTYTITGAAATIAAGRLFNAEAGTYTLTGVAASLLVGRLLSADAGVYTITGAAAELLATRLLSADAGVYTITGAAVELLAGRALSADPGSYTLSGSAATLLAARVLSADPGVYVITGVDATLVYVPVGGAFELNLEPGVYVLTGAAATLLGDRLLSADAGIYNILGFNSEMVYEPVPSGEVSHGFYGVSFRRKRREEEIPVPYAESNVAEAIRAAISSLSNEPLPSVKVDIELVGAGEEMVMVKIGRTNIRKDYLDTIIIAILASEL